MRPGSQASSVRRTRPPGPPTAASPVGVCKGCAGTGAFTAWGLCTARGGAVSGWFTPRYEHSTAGVEELGVENGGRRGPEQAPPPARTSHPPALGMCLLLAQSPPPALETHSTHCPEPHTPLLSVPASGELGSRRGQWVPGSFSVGLERQGGGCVCDPPPPPQTPGWPGSSPLPPSTDRPLWALRLVGKQWGQRPGLAGKVGCGQKGQGLPRQQPRQRTRPGAPQVRP